jgi:hypothetical protein
MNRKFVLIWICAAALGLAGLQAFAQDKPDQSTQQPANPGQSTQQPANPGAQPNPSDQKQAGGQGDQSKEAVPDSEVAARVDARLQQLTTELGLSDDQKSQIKPILVDAARRLQAVKNDPQRSVDSKTSKMDEIHDSARGQIRQFLTPDQNKKLDAMKGEDII